MVEGDKQQSEAPTATVHRAKTHIHHGLPDGTISRYDPGDELEMDEFTPEQIEELLGNNAVEKHTPRATKAKRGEAPKD